MHEWKYVGFPSVFLEPTLTGGKFEYDFGDTAMTTPLLPMFTLGHDFVPPPIHAGGLRYHGDSPIISLLVKTGRMDAVAYPQGKTFEACTPVGPYLVTPDEVDHAADLEVRCEVDGVVTQRDAVHVVE